MSGSVTTLIWRSTSSDVTASPGDVSISGSDILLGVCSSKLSVSVLLSVSSDSTATDLFLYQEKRLWLDYKVEFSRVIVKFGDESYGIYKGKLIARIRCSLRKMCSETYYFSLSR